MWPLRSLQQQTQPEKCSNKIFSFPLFHFYIDILWMDIHTCSFVCDFVTWSLPTLMRGRRNAFVISVTFNPNKCATFCATVLSGKDAWSEFLSCLNCIFPNCKTEDTTRKMEPKSSGFKPMMFIDFKVAWNSAMSSTPGTGNVPCDRNV